MSEKIFVVRSFTTLYNSIELNNAIALQKLSNERSYKFNLIGAAFTNLVSWVIFAILIV